MRMRMAVFNNILRQNVSYFDDARHSPAKLATRLATDAPNVRAAIDVRLANTVSSLFSLVLGFGMGFYYGWQMTLILAVVCPLSVLSTMLRVRARSYGAASDNRLLEQASKVAAESIENIRTVHATMQHTYFYDEYSHNVHGPYREGLRQAMIQAVTYGFAAAFMYFANAAAFRFGAWEVGERGTTPNNVYMTYFAVSFSSNAIAYAASFFPEYD